MKYHMQPIIYVMKMAMKFSLMILQMYSIMYWATIRSSLEELLLIIDFTVFENLVILNSFNNLGSLKSLNNFVVLPVPGKISPNGITDMTSIVNHPLRYFLAISFISVMSSQVSTSLMAWIKLRDRSKPNKSSTIKLKQSIRVHFYPSFSSKLNATSKTLVTQEYPTKNRIITSNTAFFLFSESMMILSFHDLDVLLVFESAEDLFVSLVQVFLAWIVDSNIFAEALVPYSVFLFLRRYSSCKTYLTVSFGLSSSSRLRLLSTC